MTVMLSELVDHVHAFIVFALRKLAAPGVTCIQRADPTIRTTTDKAGKAQVIRFAKPDLDDVRR
jgi:hypothetical protein